VPSHLLLSDLALILLVLSVLGLRLVAFEHVILLGSAAL
jgi:hypothetical protein